MDQEQEIVIAARCLADAMLKAADGLTPAEYVSVQRAALTAAKRVGGLNDDGNLTAVGMTRAASYLRWSVKARA
jgi:hypothetical protein